MESILLAASLRLWVVFSWFHVTDKVLLDDASFGQEARVGFLLLSSTDKHFSFWMYLNLRRIPCIFNNLLLQSLITAVLYFFSSFFPQGDLCLLVLSLVMFPNSFWFIQSIIHLCVKHFALYWIYFLCNLKHNLHNILIEIELQT